MKFKLPKIKLNRLYKPVAVILGLLGGLFIIKIIISLSVVVSLISLLPNKNSYGLNLLLVGVDNVEGTKRSDAISVIHINNSNTNLTNVIIQYNQADYGGGFFTSNVDGYFDDLIIHSNSSLNGGGVFINNYSKIYFFNTVFSYNNANSFGGAVALEQDSNLELKYCTLNNNNASFYGGGIYAWENSKVNIINNTIINNESQFGSAVTSISQSNTNIINSIVWSNLNDDYFTDNNSIKAYYSNIQYELGGEKNIRINPNFQNIFFNSLLLANNSKCIDKGVKTFILNNDTLFNHTSYTGLYPDIGSNEYVGTVGDINNDNNFDLIDILLLINIISDQLSYKIICDLNNDGYNDILDVISLFNWTINS